MPEIESKQGDGDDQRQTFLGGTQSDRYRSDVVRRVHHAQDSSGSTPSRASYKILNGENKTAEKNVENKTEEKVDNYNYLQGFNPDELKEFRDAYREQYKGKQAAHHAGEMKQEAELENKDIDAKLNEIAGNYYKNKKGRYWTNYVINLVSIIQDIPFTYFAIQTSYEGIQKAYYPNASNALAYGLGAPFAVIDLFFNLTLMQPGKSTVKGILRRHLSGSAIGLDLRNTLGCAAKMVAITSWSIHTSVHVVHNFTGGIANIIELYSGLAAFSFPVAVVALVVVLGSSYVYYQETQNAKYQSGKKFFNPWSQQNRVDPHDADPKVFSRPYLFQEVRNGNFTVPWRVFVQGASAVIGRAYPSLAYLAQAAAKTLGFWFIPLPIPTSLVSENTMMHIVGGYVIWDTLLKRYESTYKHYLDKQLEMRKRIKQKMIVAATRQVHTKYAGNQISSLSLKDSERTMQGEIDRVAEKLATDYYNTLAKEIALTWNGSLIFEGYKNFFSVAPMLIFEAGVGGWMAYQMTSLLAMGALSSAMIPVGIFVLGALCYKGETQTLLHERMLKKMQEEAGESLSPENKKSYSAWIKAIAIFITIGSAVSRMTSGVGSGLRISGAEDYKSIIMLISSYIAINTARTFYGDTLGNVAGLPNTFRRAAAWCCSFRSCHKGRNARAVDEAKAGGAKAENSSLSSHESSGGAFVSLASSSAKGTELTVMNGDADSKGDSKTVQHQKSWVAISVAR